MKTILVPIDFSDESKNACKVAASIANVTGSEIILLHMLDIPSASIDPIDASAMKGGAQTIFFMKSIHKRFEEYKKLDFFEGLKITENVIFNKAFQGVIDESKKHLVDLIVMGSQGATGIKEMLVGSNTEKVVRKSDIPVLVIKQPVENFAINDVIFASDFSKESQKSFQRVLNFAKLFDATLHLLFVNTAHRFETSKETKEKLDKFTRDFELTNHTLNVYNDITIEEGILNFGKKIDADVIAINTHGRSGLSQLFSESISTDLANHALRPVITFKI